MTKIAGYVGTVLISAIAVTSLLALPAVAAELKNMKSGLKTEKPDFTAARQKLQSKARSETAKGNTDFQTKRVNFERTQKAQLDSRNAQARAEIQRLKTNAEQIKKIRAEAIQMNSKYGSASAAEKVKMDKRAGDLMNELDGL